MDTFLSPRGLSTAHATGCPRRIGRILRAFHQKANEAALFRDFYAGGSPE
jgi:hypothetical protein